MFPLAPGSKIPGIGKSGYGHAIFINSVPTAMVKMQMRIDDYINFFRLKACSAQVVHKLFFRKEEAFEPVRKLVSNASFDEHSLFTGADKHGIAAHADTIELVCRDLALPHGFWNDAEESAAIAHIRSV